MTESNKKPQLAVLIPAYKQVYLRKTLQSFANQTNKNFNMYIGDDASPDDIETISKEFKDNLNIHYVRFKENIGRDNLVAQWNRCVRLSNEPWIWLFSDDDVANDNCVDNFYKTLNKTESQYNVYVFNTFIIDRKGKLICVSPPLPARENVYEFIYHRLAGQRNGCATNFIFSRNSFEKAGGFINFDLAWYSDDASLIEFTGSKGFYTIEGGHVKFRANSSINLSSPSLQYRARKIKAFFDYFEWITKKFEGASFDGCKIKQDVSAQLFRASMLRNLIYIGGVPITMMAYVFNKMRGYGYSSRLKNFIELCKLNLQTKWNTFIEKFYF